MAEDSAGDIARGAGPRVVYFHQEDLYVNLTNRCPASCLFCLKYAADWHYEGSNLKLEREPTAREILRKIKAAAPKKEIVFCGLGEPTCRLETLTEVGSSLKRQGYQRLRLITIGLGNMINGIDIVPGLASWLDRISVSLNTADPAQWTELVQPGIFRDRGFYAVAAFIESCVDHGIETTVTAVDFKGVDISKVEAMALRLGACFRLRPLIGQ